MAVDGKDETLIRDSRSQCCNFCQNTDKHISLCASDAIVSLSHVIQEGEYL